jgi:hypothetical protein
MLDYISIGSTPSGETCAQVGSEDYDNRSRKECRAFVNQLRRVFGEEVCSAQLKIKSFPHDFGSYREVICYFSDTDDDGMEYAFKLENECPEYWDEQAKEELQLV